MTKKLSLQQQVRLSLLKKKYGHDIAVGKQQGFNVGKNDDEALAVLESHHLSAQVAELLNSFMSGTTEGSPNDAMMALGIVFQTAATGLAELHKQDPELALRLGAMVQSQLEKALSNGDLDDGTKD